MNEKIDQKVFNKSLSAKTILMVALGFEFLALIGGDIASVFLIAGLIIGILGLINVITEQSKQTETSKTKMINWVIFLVWLISHICITKFSSHSSMTIVGMLVNLLYVGVGILPFWGLWILLKNKITRILFFKWFVSSSVILLVVYLFIYGFTKEYLQNTGGVLILAFILSLLATFIHKSSLEKKQKQTCKPSEPEVSQHQKMGITQDQRYCSKCGQKISIDKDVKFCSNCGAELKES